MTSTAIESKLIREGGTIIPIQGIEYHFKPYTDGAHVCEVENTEHADLLLAIREGYRLYRGTGLPLGPLSAPALAAARAAQAEKEEPAPAAEPAPATVPDGMINMLGGDYPPTFTIHGIEYKLSTIVSRAYRMSGLSSDEWNEAAQDVRDQHIESVLDGIDASGDAAAPAPAAEAPADPAEAEAAERATLVAEYVALVGKKPHYNVGIDKLRGMVEAERENAAKHAAEQK